MILIFTTLFLIRKLIFCLKTSLAYASALLLSFINIHCRIYQFSIKPRKFFIINASEIDKQHYFMKTIHVYQVSVIIEDRIVFFSGTPCAIIH